MKTLLSLLVLVSAAGCVQGSLSDSFAADEDMSFDIAAPSAFTLPACSNATTFTTTQSTSFDIHDPLSQLAKQGNLTVSFSENSISGDLSSFKHARIFINNDNQAPQLLTETDFAATNGVVNLPIVLDTNTLVGILSAGKANLTVDLSTCVPAAPVKIHYTLGGDMSLSVNKSL